ncbi:discoidin domain-containing protein [Paenibacillus lautus]|uniref:discoidin domain-containing protein n=1 Tax=Paenibacillus lautus TaxID=1401 RepID=UPI003D2C52BC
MYRIVEQTQAEMQQGIFSSSDIFVDTNGILTLTNRNRTVNHALHRPYTRSDNSKFVTGDSDVGNIMFTDGITNKPFQYLSTTLEELVVDLGASKKIGGFSFLTGWTSAGTPHYVELLGSLDGINFSSLTRIGTGENFQQSFLGAFESTNARYVKFRLTRQNAYNICVGEGEVYAGETYTEYRESVYDLSNIGVYRNSHALWIQEAPIGTSVKVETSLSTDGGITWGDWFVLDNNSPIKGISHGADLSNAKLKVKVTLSTNSINVPTFGAFNLYFDDQSQVDSGYIVIPNAKYGANTVNPPMTSNNTPTPYVVTSTGNVSETTYPPYLAFNGAVAITTGDSWRINRGASITLDLGERNNKAVSKYAIRHYSTNYTREVTLEGSIDNKVWYMLDHSYNLQNPADKTNTIELDYEDAKVKIPYRYYKVTIVDFSNSGYIDEVMLYASEDGMGHQISGHINIKDKTILNGSIEVKSNHITDTENAYSNTDVTPAMTSSRVGKCEVYANYEQAGSEAYKAFDHYPTSSNLGNGWYATYSFYPADAYPYIVFNFGDDNEKAINRYSLTARNASSATFNMPVSWNVYGSKDQENWTLIDSKTTTGNWSAGEERFFEFVNTEKYQWYKLEVLKTQQNTQIINIDEIKYFENTPIRGYQFESNLIVPQRNNLRSNIVIKGNNLIVIGDNYNVEIPKMTSDTSPAPYVASASSVSSTTYPAWKAFNGIVDVRNDSWIASKDNNEWLQIDYGVGNGKFVTSYAITNVEFTNGTQNAPKKFKLLASNDEVNWVEFDNRENEIGWSSYERRVYKTSGGMPAEKFRFYRLYVYEGFRGSGRSISVGQLELFGTNPIYGSQLKSNLYVKPRSDVRSSLNVKSTNIIIISNNNPTIPAMTADNVPAPYVVKASSINSTSYPAWKAFDQKNAANTDSWISASGKYSGEWIQIDYGAGNEKYISSYSISARYNTNLEGTLKSFRLLASNDETNWVTIDTRMEENPWTSAEKRTYVITGNPAEKFRYYRLEVMTVQLGTYVAIGELELMGVSDVYGTQLKSRLQVKERAELQSSIFVSYYNRLNGVVKITPSYNYDLPSSLGVAAVSDLSSNIKIPFYNRMQGVVDIQPPPRITMGLNPTQDAFVREGVPTLNYGIDQSMLVGYSSSYDELYRSTLQFDLSSVPTGQVITKANLYLFSNKTGAQGVKVGVYEYGEPWTERGITWKNHVDSNILITSNEFENGKQYIQFDLLDLVKDWYTDQKTNNGLLVKMLDESIQDQFQFYTRESAGLVKPVLEIEYYNPVIDSFVDTTLVSNLFIPYHKDLKSSVRVPFYNVPNSLKSQIKVKDKDSIWGNLFVNQKTMFASITVRQNRDEDLASSVTVVQTEIKEITGNIFVIRENLLGNIVVPYMNDINSSINIRRTDDSDLPSNMFVSNGTTTGNIVVPYRTEIMSSIKILGSGESELKSNLFVSRGTIRGNIEVVKSSMLPSFINVRRTDNKSINTKIIIPSRSDIPTKLSVLKNSDIIGNIKIYSGDLRCSIFVPYHEDSEITSSINVRVRWASDMPTILRVSIDSDDGAYAFIM